MAQKKNITLTKREKTIKAIAESYINTEHSIVRQLKLETPNHHLTTGTTRERVWLNLFESIVPKKFCIDQGVFIIDSYGNISAEIDLAIFDESYTPYIFKFENIKFIPIEAVAVAVQCKSGNMKGVGAWVKSIRDLKSSYKSVLRIMPGIINGESDFKRDFKSNQELESRNLKITEGNKKFQETSWPKELEKKKTRQQTSTRPILILCTAVESASVSSELQNDFDIVLSVDKEEKLKKTIIKEDEDYAWWSHQLNHYGHKRYEKEEQKLLKNLEPEMRPTQKNLKMLKVQMNNENEENVLLSLTFQLNQLLMLINNPMPFPHQAYADMFRENYKKFSKLNTQVEETKESKK